MSSYCVCLLKTSSVSILLLRLVLIQNISAFHINTSSFHFSWNPKIIKRRTFVSSSSKPVPFQNDYHSEYTLAKISNDKAVQLKEYQNRKYDLRLLILDNYDSYTYNIFSYLSTLCIEPPLVISNDAYSSWKELAHSVGKVDGIIISPGPGNPTRAKDIGICLEAIEENESLPILGICLGHQALGHYYNASVQLAPCGPIHGLTSKVMYKERSFPSASLSIEDSMDGLDADSPPKCHLFHGIPQNFDVVRYHSLVVIFPNITDHENGLMIEPTAWANGVNGEGGNIVHHEEDICMALQHRLNPHYGVQFHPESVGTGRNGYLILQNFCDFCAKWKEYKYVGNEILHWGRNETKKNETNDHLSMHSDGQKKGQYQVYVQKVDPPEMNNINLPSPSSVFEALYASMEDTFWLDSSNGRQNADVDELKKLDYIDHIEEGCPIASNSRFSFMGGNGGPLCKTIEYWGKDHNSDLQGLFVKNNTDGSRVKIDSNSSIDIISYLQNETKHNGELSDIVYLGQTKDDVGNVIPFDFLGGYVGYLGYEVRHDTRQEICQHQTCRAFFDNSEAKEDTCSDPLIPTAAFLFADRSLVYDHWREDWYMVGVTTADLGADSIRQWMKETQNTILSLEEIALTIKSEKYSNVSSKKTFFELRRSKEQYASDIAHCHEEIRNGESYELCLTNQLTAKLDLSASKDELYASPFGLYKILRKRNPAPFSSFMKFGNPIWTNSTMNKASVSICCSSPERFLSVKKLQSNQKAYIRSGTSHGSEFTPKFVSDYTHDDDRFIVESKPIKGTTHRIIHENINDEQARRDDEKNAEDLRISVKNRAENLMIVDLIRNDLSKICEPGSVYVPKLMGIESFATVHQMVSTIRGVLDSGRTPVDVIAASFPGGSMTGAPKRRSIDILHNLELGYSRGPYSGCLGYISLDGSMDMNIIIRTAVVTPDIDGTEKNKWIVRIGAGGAITALSKSEDEFNELLLKSRAIQESVEEWCTSFEKRNE